MSERSREFIAIKFSEDRVGKGWKVLDSEGITLNVVNINNRLVYIFSTDNWEVIKEKFISEGVDFVFQNRPVIRKSDLEDLQNWQKGGEE